MAEDPHQGSSETYSNEFQSSAAEGHFGHSTALGTPPGSLPPLYAVPYHQVPFHEAYDGRMMEDRATAFPGPPQHANSGAAFAAPLMYPPMTPLGQMNPSTVRKLLLV
jgi:hypothetical protein